MADHDFTKCKVTPSVSLVVDIPDSIEDSFYQGQLFVMLKDSIFLSSSPLRQAAELIKVLKAAKINTVLKPCLLLYTDGGPDHRVT